MTIHKHTQNNDHREMCAKNRSQKAYAENDPIAKESARCKPAKKRMRADKKHDSETIFQDLLMPLKIKQKVVLKKMKKRLGGGGGGWGGEGGSFTWKFEEECCFPVLKS